MNPGPDASDPAAAYAVLDPTDNANNNFPVKFLMICPLSWVTLGNAIDLERMQSACQLNYLKLIFI